MSDYKGAALMLAALPNKAEELLADKGYHAIGSAPPSQARAGSLHPLEIQSKGPDPL